MILHKKLAKKDIDKLFKNVVTYIYNIHTHNITQMLFRHRREENYVSNR